MGKRKQVSPQKNGENPCAGCDMKLKPDAKAMLCDGCEKWLCISCIEMTESRYNLINKLGAGSSFSWYCPLCLADPARKGATVEDVNTIVNEQIDCLKIELLAEMTIVVDSVAERVSEIEIELLKKCHKADMETQVKYLVGEELKVLKETLTNEFHAELAKAHKSEACEEVRDEIRRDHDKQHRRLNIIAHGIREFLVYKPGEGTG